jgi:hypothetical protein
MAMEERWTFGSGTVVARVLAPTVILVKMVGVQDDPRVVKAFATWFGKLPREREGFHMFWDTEENSGYKTQNREALEQWYKQALPLFVATNVLVRSKLMAMAVSISNLTMGGSLKATSDRAKFEGLIASALRVASRPMAASAAP